MWLPPPQGGALPTVPTRPLSPPPSLQANLFPAALVHFGAKEPAGECRWLGPVLEPGQPVSGPQSQLPGRAFSLGPPLGLRGSSAAPNNHLPERGLGQPPAGHCPPRAECRWADAGQMLGGWRVGPPSEAQGELGPPCRCLPGAWPAGARHLPICSRHAGGQVSACGSGGTSHGGTHHPASSPPLGACPGSPGPLPHCQPLTLHLSLNQLLRRGHWVPPSPSQGRPSL